MHLNEKEKTQLQLIATNKSWQCNILCVMFMYDDATYKWPIASIKNADRMELVEINRKTFAKKKKKKRKGITANPNIPNQSLYV